MKWFKFGTKLAIQQDILFDFIKDLKVIHDPKKAKELQQNVWVALSCRLAPSNLVIRQYCLIDLLAKKPVYRNKIMWLLKKLAPYDTNDKYFWTEDACIWLEGYSYWFYVKHFLCLYVEKFKDEEISKYIARIDRGFALSSYKRNNHLAPAPFGALRDVPLEESLQNKTPLNDIILLPLCKLCENVYSVDKHYLGFNSHVPHKAYICLTEEGHPDNFEYYTGFDNKYANVFEEIFDMLRWGKIWSAIKLTFEKKK